MGKLKKYLLKELNPRHGHKNLGNCIADIKNRLHQLETIEFFRVHGLLDTPNKLWNCLGCKREFYALDWSIKIGPYRFCLKCAEDNWFKSINDIKKEYMEVKKDARKPNSITLSPTITD